MNALEQHRQGKHLSYAEIGRKAGYGRATVMKHCKGELPISDGAALRYHLHLGIPLQSLRPDLFKGHRKPLQKDS